MDNQIYQPTTKKNNFLVFFGLLFLLLLIPITLLVSKQNQQQRSQASLSQGCFICGPKQDGYTQDSRCQATFDRPYWTILPNDLTDPPLGKPHLAAVKGEGEGGSVFIQWLCPSGVRAVAATIKKPVNISMPDSAPINPCGFILNPAQEENKTLTWNDVKGKTEGLIRCDNLFYVEPKGVGLDIIKQLEVEFTSVAYPPPLPN